MPTLRAATTDREREWLEYAALLHDTLFGDQGNDLISAGAGNDIASGSEDADQIVGARRTEEGTLRLLRARAKDLAAGRFRIRRADILNARWPAEMRGAKPALARGELLRHGFAVVGGGHVTRGAQRRVGVVAGDSVADSTAILATGKRVVVIGGGDTGADCVGNSIREGATSVVQLELLPEPPANRPDDRTPWPLWPAKFRLSYAMEEARAVERGEQDFSVVTTELTGNGRVQRLHYAQAEAKPPFGPVEGTEGVLDADLVLLAMGFLSPEPTILEQLELERDARGNAKAPTYETSVPGVFAAGDARRGQSLIVWAINEGRQCARMVNRYIKALDDGNGRGTMVGRRDDARGHFAAAIALHRRIGARTWLARTEGDAARLLES